jgi:outer membrane protein assembly factor BamD
VLGFNSSSRLSVSFIFGLAALALTSCASNYDETADWKPEKLYAEAKEHLNGKLYEKAISLYEKLEGRAAGSILSQQAQIEKAYAQYKSGDAVMAVSTLDRFIKINPASPSWTMLYYLKGLANFNDDLGFLSQFHQARPLRA